jgi:hypothetical protein
MVTYRESEGGVVVEKNVVSTVEKDESDVVTVLVLGSLPWLLPTGLCTYHPK